jgi:acyl phosphate:glycerol-3-phosphate acyltransferase
MTDSNIHMAINIALLLAGYLLGSVSSAVIVCRSMGLGDPRVQGSGNPGATNVLRLHGKTVAALTLLGDVLKGVLPLLLAHAARTTEMIIALTALAAFAGHLYPVFFGFRGGKGVATLIGVLLGLYWLLGLAFIGTWLLIALLFRYSSLSALVASAMTPVYAVLLASNTYTIAITVVMAVILFWRHRSNIRNLLAGTEDKIGADSP